MKSVDTYSIILAGGEASIFERGDAWKLVPIQGEDFSSLGSDPKSGLSTLIDELCYLRNSDKSLSDVAVHLFYAADSLDAAGAWPAIATKSGCKDWQIVRFERWLSAARQGGDIHFGPPLRYGSWLSASTVGSRQKEEVVTPTWLCRMMLHLISSPLASEALNKEFARLEEESLRQARSLEEQNADLVARNRQLKAQLASMQSLDVESLTSYFPAFFSNFWSKVGSEELVQISGRLPAPRIESPYSPLPQATVLLQKKRFLNLPEAERSRILELASQMRQTHNLTVHPEIRDLLEGAS